MIKMAIFDSKHLESKRAQSPESVCGRNELCTVPQSAKAISEDPASSSPYNWIGISTFSIRARLSASGAKVADPSDRYEFRQIRAFEFRNGKSKSARRISRGAGAFSMSGRFALFAISLCCADRFKLFFFREFMWWFGFFVHCFVFFYIYGIWFFCEFNSLFVGDLNCIYLLVNI